ncbi:MAG: adenylyltransferase/cytidyltransferase family protein [Candidatus Anstonellales archaeon]
MPAYNEGKAKKHEKELIKKLYIMQIKNKGISKEEKLPEMAYEYLNLVKGRYWLKEAARKKITVVATGGVFDVIHYGHILTLKEAKKLGDVLIVIVAKDDIAKQKGRVPFHNQNERVELVNCLKFVDLAIPGVENLLETANLIKPDIIAFGYDQLVFHLPYAKSIKINVAYKPDIIKTTNILRGLGHV